MRVAFPSLAFFQSLQTLMRQEEVRFRRLGFVDTTFGVHIVDAHGQEWRYLLTFEVFECREAVEVTGFDLTAIDFVLKGDLPAWIEMLQNIQQHSGADVTHSLNTLTHFGERMQVLYDDPDGRDKLFRFQESIQQFFDLSVSLDLEFPAGNIHNVSASAQVS